MNADFINVQHWKQPGCPSKGEWINKQKYLCNEILFSHLNDGYKDSINIEKCL